MNKPKLPQDQTDKLTIIKSISRIQFFIAILICIYGCNKQPENQETTLIHLFPGIVVIDDIGQQIARWGTDDGDWKTDNSWSEEEFALINFPDTINLDGTYIKDTTGWNTGSGIHEQPQNIVIVYPNPANNEQILVYRGLGLLKFKVTIVDKYFNRLFIYACKDSISNIHLDFSDSTKFQNGTIYRMYYSLSATDSLNFYKGHGDILICRESELQDCQKFVP